MASSRFNLLLYPLLPGCLLLKIRTRTVKTINAKCWSLGDSAAVFPLHHDVSRSWRLLRGPGRGVALLNVSQRCQLTAEAPQEGAEMEQKLPADFNHTTQHITTSSPAAGSGVYYALVPCVLLTLLGCVVAVVRGTAPQSSLHCTGSGSQTRSQKLPCFSFRFCTSGGGRGKSLL